MSRVAELLCSRRVVCCGRGADFMSVWLAGCSADMHRLSRKTLPIRVAGSHRHVPPAQRAPSGRIESRPLPQYPAHRRRRNLARHRITAPEPSPACPEEGADCRLCAAHAADRDHRHGRAAVGRLDASWSAPTAPPSSSAPTTRSRLAQRYNVSGRRVMRANGLQTPRNLQPGQRWSSRRRPRPLRSGAGGAAEAVAAAPPRRRSCRQSRRDAVRHCPQEQRPGREARQGQQPPITTKLKTRPEDHRARHQDRGHRRPRRSRSPSPPAQPAASCAVVPPGASASLPKESAQASRPSPRKSRRTRQARKPPARCRPSAGRCAAR